jgi:tetratricopeptide (TPR) repeat protein
LALPGGLTRAGIWLGQPYEGPGSLLAWKYRDKLSPPDRALLDVFLGSRWPALRQWRDGIAAAERFVQIAPDNAEAWSELGDNLYHFGFLVGIPDAHQRAAQAFAQSLALDSSFAPALEHGSSLAMALGDTAGARKALAVMFRIDSASSTVASERWQFAVALGDTAARREVLRSDSLNGAHMMAIGLSSGLPLQDADEVLRKARARAVTLDDQTWAQRSSHYNALIIGWPSRAGLLPAAIPEKSRLTQQYLEARIADADPMAGAAAGTALGRTIGAPLTAEFESATGRYAAGQWALDRGRLELAQRALADLETARVPPDSAWLREITRSYALLLGVQLAARRRSAELPSLLAQLDSALVNASLIPPLILVGNLVASRLYEEQGDLPRALAAIRRRVWDLFPNPYYVTYHREEGRLAALNGDREGAIRAYRRYLALRSGAEPRLQLQVARVRAELEALERESSDK